jgi:RHS repeat-associated protein
LRLSKRTAGPIIENYSYVPGGNGANTTSTKIAQIAYTGVTQYFTNTTLSYTYDALGNIETVTKDGVTTTYTYDEQNQLTQEQTKNGNTVTSTSTYTYDTYGNIREKKVYSGAVTSANLEKTYTYSYPTTGWLDQLTGIKIDNGTTQSFTYDAIGNPLTYKNGTNWTFTWKNGRQLATASASGKNSSYTYDVNGIRDSKTVNGVVHNYATLNGQMVRETWTENGKTHTLDVLMDNNSAPYALVHNDGTKIKTYYYVLNQQGDVIRLTDDNGATYANYTYNAWGELLRVYLDDGRDITDPGDIAHLNPIRYRGYYYDTETGFYYVGGRYYDPTLCRFVNADNALLVNVNPDGFTDKNLFAYCDNNPVNRTDDGGSCWTAIVGRAIAGGIVGAASSAINSVMNGEKIKAGDIAAAAVQGAAQGALGGFTAFAGVSRVTMAVVNGAISAVFAAKSGGNPMDTLISAGTSFASTLVGGFMPNVPTETRGVQIAYYAITGMYVGGSTETFGTVARSVYYGSSKKSRRTLRRRRSSVSSRVSSRRSTRRVRRSSRRRA